MTERRGAVATLLGHELRNLMRDRRTVLISLVAPLLVTPVVLFLSQGMELRRQQRRDDRVYRYAVQGSQAEAARERIAAALALSPSEELPALELVEDRFDDPGAALRLKLLDFYVDARPLAEGVPLLRLMFKADRDSSRTGARRLRDRLERWRDLQRETLLIEAGYQSQPGELLRVEALDRAAPGRAGGAWLGSFLTLLVLVLVLTGGAVVATDSLAGEKERGTLETLLTSAVGRGEIAAAKLLAILIVALTITAVQVGNLLVYLRLDLFALPAELRLAITPLDALLVLVLLLPVATLAAALLLLLSARASTYKEAQLLFVPLFLLGILPALASLLPGLSLRSVVVLVPVAGTSVAVREVLAGRPDALFLLLCLASNLAAAAWALRAAVRALADERLLLPGAGDLAGLDGPRLFERRVLVWFAVMAAVLLLVALNSGASGGLGLQLFFNLIVLFGGGSLLMLRRYRLDVDAALAWRAPHPAVWLAVLIGVPSVQLLAVGVFKLSGFFLPVPVEALERFGEALLPGELPTWQLLVLIALLPGFFEELAFRGLLLHGLRRRFHPVVLALVVGGIFGLFHVELFRLLPTAFLGVVLSAVVLLSGSIFPAMVWHGANNALAVLAERGGVDFSEPGASGYLLGLAGLAVTCWILVRTRRPYPDLRPFWSRHG